MVETMITVDEALDRIFTRIPTPLPETVPLGRAHKRVLLTPLLAKHTQPPFDASAMDGYAVRANEIEPGKPVFMAGTSQAGSRFTGMMQSGECVRIFTGAPLPIGADAVIMQEQATAHGNQVMFHKAARVGQSVRRKGNDFTEGKELLPAGVGLTPAMLNLAASANYPELTVAKRPRLAILATGDELVPPARRLDLTRSSPPIPMASSRCSRPMPTRWSTSASSGTTSRRWRKPSSGHSTTGSKC